MSKTGNLAALTPIFNASDIPTLFYAEDPPCLPRILVFYWPVATVGSVTSTSRIRATILSAAGFVSFPPFQLSPSSAYYSAVHKLPEDKQRDDVCRGIAFSLLKYFGQLSPAVKNAIIQDHFQHGFGPKIFGQLHAAEITNRLGRVVNAEEVIDALRGFSKHHISVQSNTIVPHASIRRTRPSILPADGPADALAPLGLIRALNNSPPLSGRRTTSHSMNVAKRGIPASEQKQTAKQKEDLRFKMCEFVDTEERYVSKLHEMIQTVIGDARAESLGRTAKSSKSTNAMIRFPPILDQILEANTEFLDEVSEILDRTEESAMISITEHSDTINSGSSGQEQDQLGTHAFAKVLLNHFPKFLMPYREYLDLQPKFTASLHQSLIGSDTSSLQRVRSMLMEPVQRISRYSLFIDAMTSLLPSSATATAKLLSKARDIIAEICAMEPSASTILGSLRIEHEDRKVYRPLSPQKLLSTLRSGTGSIREAPPVVSPKDSPTGGPKMLPSVMRSFSKKSRSGTLTKQHLSERNVNIRQDDVLVEEPLQQQYRQSQKSFPENLNLKRSHILLPPPPAMMMSYTELQDECQRLRDENRELRHQLRTCTCNHNNNHNTSNHNRNHNHNDNSSSRQAGGSSNNTTPSRIPMSVGLGLNCIGGGGGGGSGGGGSGSRNRRV